MALLPGRSRLDLPPDLIQEDQAPDLPPGHSLEIAGRLAEEVGRLSGWKADPVQGLGVETLTETDRLDCAKGQSGLVGPTAGADQAPGSQVETSPFDPLQGPPADQTSLKIRPVAQGKQDLELKSQGQLQRGGVML